ncbi:MAG: glycosyltransferase [Blastocatellia bacterium]
MKLVIFGLAVSSSWGNGHATLWRGLLRALVARRHQVIFFERDVPYYAAHRDLIEIPGAQLVFYQDWAEIRHQAMRLLTDADVGMVTSYCPDALAATELVLAEARLRVFYDLDTPITLAQLSSGRRIDYIGPRGLRDFDLVLSYTGGAALTELVERLGARRVAPLYGSVDPAAHYPVPPTERFRADLSYLGTYAADRQATLQELFIETARLIRQRRFLIGGAQYPPEFPWTENIYFVRHLPPCDHAAFYCSSTLTLNVTRQAMAEMGWCPSGRLFEAAACGVPIISDWWPGLDEFFTPNEEILIARQTADVVNALELSQAELKRTAAQARARVLSEHTAERRAAQLESILSEAMSSQAQTLVGSVMI